MNARINSINEDGEELVGPFFKGETKGQQSIVIVDGGREGLPINGIDDLLGTRQMKTVKVVEGTRGIMNVSKKGLELGRNDGVKARRNEFHWAKGERTMVLPGHWCLWRRGKHEVCQLEE